MKSRVKRKGSELKVSNSLPKEAARLWGAFGTHDAQVSALGRAANSTVTSPDTVVVEITESSSWET